MGLGNLLKWEVGMRKLESFEVGSRNAEVGKKEGEKVGRLEGGRIKVKGERIKVEGESVRRRERKKVGR
jgi:hypothetical protein